MSKSTVILGKGGVGKTFVAAHVAMALGYLGEKTLVVGCDQKQDTVRALSPAAGPSLMEALESAGYDHERVDLAALTTTVSPYVDSIELGPSQLLVGQYAGVLDEANHFFRAHNVLSPYSHVVYDLSEERFDATCVALFRRAECALAVTDDTPESLFVLNRLLRAVLIGSYEFKFPLRVIGAINNRSLDPLPFDRYTERTRCFPLLRIPESADLAHLRPFHRTLFALNTLAEPFAQVLDGFIKIAELLRGEPFNLNPMVPLENEEIWKLARPVSLPS